MTNGPGTESRLTNISQYHVENYRFDSLDPAIPHPPTACTMRGECLEYTGLDIHAGIHPGGTLHKKRPHSQLCGLLTE